jgi:hypothetical protein
MLWEIVTAIGIGVVLSSTARSQFETGRSYIGPHIGLGSYESAVSFGGAFEYALTKPDEMGPGRIGLGATVDYWKWDGGVGNTYYWSYSWVPISFFGAYHFVLSDRKWDLFAGLGLSYIIVNSTWHDQSGAGSELSSASYNSGLYWSGVAGARYFFSPGLAMQARLGWGASLLSIGVDFGI